MYNKAYGRSARGTHPDPTQNLDSFKSTSNIIIIIIIMIFFDVKKVFDSV